jgi:hypothetical protein
MQATQITLNRIVRGNHYACYLFLSPVGINIETIYYTYLVTRRLYKCWDDRRSLLVFLGSWSLLVNTTCKIASSTTIKNKLTHTYNGYERILGMRYIKCSCVGLCCTHSSHMMHGWKSNCGNGTKAARNDLIRVALYMNLASQSCEQMQWCSNR